MLHVTLMSIAEAQRLQDPRKNEGMLREALIVSTPCEYITVSECHMSLESMYHRQCVRLIQDLQILIQPHSGFRMMTC